MPPIDIETGHTWRDGPLNQRQPGLRVTAERGWIAGKHTICLCLCLCVDKVQISMHLVSQGVFAILKQESVCHAGIVLFLVFAGILPLTYVVGYPASASLSRGFALRFALAAYQLRLF